MPEPGANVRSRGGDVAEGGVVVPAGTRLTPARLAAAAAAGIAALPCARRPRVAVLTTGSELVASGEQLRPGQVYEANALMLASSLEATGAEVASEPPAADEEAALRAALERGLAADVLVTSGGVSVGEHDLVRAVERELGVEEVFWRVSIKPGKPVSFGVRGDTLELQQREVGGRLRADHARGDRLAPEDFDLDVIHRMDDVSGGHDLAIRRNEDTGPRLGESCESAGTLDITPLGPDHYHGRVHATEHVPDVLGVCEAGQAH